MHLMDSLKAAGERRQGTAVSLEPFVQLLRHWNLFVSSLTDRLASRAEQGPVPPCGKRTARPEQIHRIC